MKILRRWKFLVMYGTFEILDFLYPIHDILACFIN